MSKIKDDVLQEKIKWSPHKSQKDIILCDKRNLVICAGRRWGKSAVAGYIVVRTFLQGLIDIKKGERQSVKIWIVAPSYELSRKVFNYVVQFLQSYDKRYSQFIGDRPIPQIKISEEVFIQCKSATEPDSLVGEELDLLIMDEAARIHPKIYELNLMAAMAGRKGRVVFISTPLGQNWFYQQFLKAKETNSAFQFSSLDNPMEGGIKQEEWDNIRKSVPVDVFEQEFQAVFRPGMASVFRGVRQIIRENCQEPPKSGHRYLMGLDIAKFQDFTVITIIDEDTHKVVHFDRFQKIPYTLQRERIRKAASSYLGTIGKIVIDSGNAGAVIADDLRAEGFKVEDFRFVGTISKDQQKKGSKERLVEKLSSLIEDKSIFIPPEDVLIDELETFGYDITDAGNIRYAAPPGFFDDCVDSLALACWLLKGKIRQEQFEISKAMPKIIRKQFQYY